MTAFFFTKYSDPVEFFEPSTILHIDKSVSHEIVLKSVNFFFTI